MLKQEFEAMAIKNGGQISGLLYATIEHFYTSENDYHKANGGINESKQDFVKRVFGGKVNTPASILKKITAESIRENRYALQGNATATPERLAAMDKAITEQLAFEARWNY